MALARMGSRATASVSSSTAADMPEGCCVASMMTKRYVMRIAPA